VRDINRIVVHCSATRAGEHYTAADIDRWHRARGWSGIGYHAVVLLDGTVEDGRPIERAGAHVAGHNHDSLGICYIGGVGGDGRRPEDTRTPAQRQALLGQVRAWMELYDVPVEQVYGHRELDPRKACPSFDPEGFRADLVSHDVDRTETAHELGYDELLAVLPVLDVRMWRTPMSHALDLQQMLGVRQDGIIGPKTYHALYLALAAAEAA
jgi:N-acetylmuramoyl-L-alanine amidase